MTIANSPFRYINKKKNENCQFPGCGNKSNETNTYCPECRMKCGEDDKP